MFNDLLFNDLFFSCLTVLALLACLEHWPTLLGSQVVRVVYAWGVCLLLSALGSDFCDAGFVPGGAVKFLIVRGEFVTVLGWYAIAMEI